MRISGSRIFTDGRFISGSIEFDQKIRSILPGKDEKADGAYIIPGLIDIHTHAAMGADASDGDPEGMLAMSRYYAAGGVVLLSPMRKEAPRIRTTSRSRISACWKGSMKHPAVWCA